MSDRIHEAAVALPAPDVEVVGWTSPWRRLVPLWRHGVWVASVFVLMAIAVAVRVEVQELRKDIERAESQQKEALLLHERLQLEVDARRRTAAVEAVAAELSIVTPASVERVR
ncbi:MAG: hypothetical protein EP330_14515 [Deltaproteobacteria bacterium]|nr:MAG: hypothetical protein EP330_14515 [Deltaproteobacteria bacterium]